MIGVYVYVDISVSTGAEIVDVLNFTRVFRDDSVPWTCDDPQVC